MAPPRITLRTGWAHENVGDVGHTPGTLRLLYERFPDGEITVWSNGLNPAVEALLRGRFPRLRLVTGHPYEQGKKCPADLARALDETDLFIVNSGMLMNYGLFGYSWDGVAYNLYPLLRCAERGVPFGIYGQSFDRFAHPSLSFFRPILERAAFIFTRETCSARYLRRLGFAAPVIEFGPDGCWGIDTRDDAGAAAWLTAHGLERDRFLIVNVRSNSPVSVQADSPLNPLNPTSAQQAENERWMGVCAAVITRWVRATGLPVLVAPEAKKEIGAVPGMLLPRLAEDVRAAVVWRDTWWNADEALSTFTAARVAFGMEPHTLIMALTGGVPVVHARPLRHGRKGWMFKDLGLGDWLFDIDRAAPERIADTVLSLHQDAGRSRARASQALAQVRARQKRTMDVIAEVLQRRGRPGHAPVGENVVP